MTTGYAKQALVVDVHQLAAVVRNRIDNVLILDSRSFLEFNTCHVIGAVNVCCSKIVKRRLQQDKVTIKELLAHSCQREVDDNSDIVVYDQSSTNAQASPADSFLTVILQKLLQTFRSVNLVSGGFLDFKACYPNLCEDKTRKCAPLTSLSQPCLATTNQGPTRILPFLFLGSQHDALDKDLLKYHNIIYELNVSTSCPKPDHIQDAHFLRIPVNDNYSEKLLPHFTKAFQFLDKVRESSGGNVLVHCLAGISRSATIAIAYIMQHMRMTSDDAYRYVKSKRVTISPNFNFLGQLLEYEKQLRREKVLDASPEPKSAPILGHEQKRLCRTDMRATHLTLNLPAPQFGLTEAGSSSTGDQSPTTALARLSFGNEEAKPIVESTRSWLFPRSMSCGQDWLTCREDSQVEMSLRATEQVVPRRNPVSEKASRKPLNRLGSEGAVVPHPLDTLSPMDEAEIDNSNDAKEQTSSSNMSWKGIPISSLKELNFTPCQTSSSSGSSSSSAATSHESTPDPFMSTVSETKSFTSYSVQTVYSSETVRVYSSTAEKCQEDVNWSCDLQSLVSDTQVDFKLPGYQRSDSVCTSGLGSEGSDFQDNCDEECEAVFQLRKVATCRSGQSVFRLQLPVSVAGSDPDNLLCDEIATEAVPSPLSPSERHLLEDLPDEGPDGCQENILECSQDSGILTSPSWSRPVASTESSFLLPTSTKEELLHMPCHNKSEALLPHFESCRKRKSQQWEDHPVSVGTEATVPPKLWEEHPIMVGQKTTIPTSRWEDHPIPVGTEPPVSSKSLLLASSNSRDGLYRAQSCPGILSWFALTLEGSTASGKIAPPSFMRQKGNGDDGSAKCRNRNSCGSLDYTEYKSPLHQYSSCESCPEVLGDRPDNSAIVSAGGSSRERRGTLSPSHRVFHHSRDMIQVS